MDGAQNPNVDFYFAKAGQWQEALTALRSLALGCGLVEELKWGVPCYTLRQGNVALLHYFGDYCAVLFPKGALLHDADGRLVQQTANTQAARQLRFSSARQVAELAATVRAYLYEALEVERAGLQVVRKTTAEFAVPEELHRAWLAAPDFKAAFAALTPGRQRAYLLHFAAPKQAKTREARVEKHRPAIMAGKGLND